MTTGFPKTLLFALSFSACASGTPNDPVPGPQGEMGAMGTPGSPGSMGTAGAAGQACWDLNGNRSCDPATEDTNDDLVCDVGDCMGTQGPAGTTGQLGASGFGTSSLTVTPATAFTLIPGLTATVSVPANAVVQISTDGALATTSTATTGFSTVDVAIQIDGNLLANGGYRRVIAANTTGLTGAFAAWNLTSLATLAPGSHTITVVAAGVGQGSDATVSGSNTSVNQGTLNVVVLKL
ncbi:MAG: hypothetical protein IPQ07_09415 [Myxococcales bacterium]|nr:hypothetical protein [Myxococcales bacterium]